MIELKKNLKIAVIGLGYVGLPLALEFAKKRAIIGFDVNKKRVDELNTGFDSNFEFSKNEIFGKKKIKFTHIKENLISANCYIVTVPTPIDRFKKPNLNPLINASKMIGKMIGKGDLIIYESTVYPGCIEEVCVPILQKFSGFKYNKDFFCGYSPERINPGDKKHTIKNIKKITSGSTLKIANIVNDLYNEIITVGTHKAPSIKVAEAAKVIENTQRDLNIALINELSILFGRLNIDTEAVLEAAGSKWNFLPFKPGLVGGHCIGVDPYYLTHKAKSVGYHPKIILSGREINDNMGSHVAKMLINEIKKKKFKFKDTKILIMGLTFKEDCADIRNSGIKNVIKILKKYKFKIDLYDPWANREEIKKTYNIYPRIRLSNNTYDAIVIAVAHTKFKKMGIKAISNLCKKKNIIYDLKYIFEKNKTSLRL